MLLEETARRVADGLSQGTGEKRLAWDELNSDQRRARIEQTVIFFLAQDEAMQALTDRGEVL
jgi:hypothetical protein